MAAWSRTPPPRSRTLSVLSPSTCSIISWRLWCLRLFHLHWHDVLVGHFPVSGRSSPVHPRVFSTGCWPSKHATAWLPGGAVVGYAHYGDALARRVPACRGRVLHSQCLPTNHRRCPAHAGRRGRVCATAPNGSSGRAPHHHPLDHHPRLHLSQVMPPTTVRSATPRSWPAQSWPRRTGCG